MVMCVQYIVQKTAKMMKFSAPVREILSMVATARISVSQKTLINGEKLQDLTVLDGAQLSALNMKSCAHPWSILVMVAQQKKSAEKPSRMLMEFFALERNTLFSLKVKITEKMETDEVDTYLHHTTAQFIVKNG